MINVGDIVQLWSNDRYIAPVNRVLASKSQPRYSLPFIFQRTQKIMRHLDQL
ncbi:MAG: hypothetical protein GXP16_12705 [Gammaproteobacteria bacterium]|nr:hypothetical protein [Gammaproteobacteria bacterium]